MIDALGASTTAALAGLFGGALMGIAVRFSNFCTLGAIEDYFYSDSDLRLRIWAMAIGVAVLGCFGLMGLGWLTPMDSFYLNQALNPLGAVVGGLMFGYGMALTGTCSFGALARVGTGDLRAFVVVLVLGVTSYMTLSGPIAYLRVWAFPVELSDAPAGIAHGLGALTGLSPVVLGLAIGLAIVVAAASGQSIREKPSAAFWGAMIGLAVVSGFAATQWIATESFGAVEVASHTYAAPPGETMLYLMTASGSTLTFGIGSVVGVLVGSFLGSLIKGHFRWEACDDPRELKRQILGAGFMGVGAVTAVGCTVGQGISAFSLLAYSAPLTLVAIFAGASFGLKQLITGFAPDV